MSEISLPWTKDGGGDDGPYSADDWADWLEMLWQTDQAASEGVAKNYLNELNATSPVANTVRIDTGGAMVKGRPYRNTATVDVSIPTPVGDTRVDRIVLRCSWSAQTIRITRIAGTEGAGTPSITQSDGVTWDLPLWQVSITTGGTITLTDERSWLHAAVRVGTDNLDDEAVTEDKLADGVFVPVGGIIMWSGSVASIPTNWHLCDGTAGTPDLRDKFIVGAGSTYSPGDTGGAATHDHSVNIASDFGGSHDHDKGTLEIDWSGNHRHSIATTSVKATGSTPAPTNMTDYSDHTHPNSAFLGRTGTAPSHQHGVNGTTGSGSSLPPYYALAYIMRIA